MAESFAEVLASFKENEDVENILPLMDSKDLQSGVIAWKSVKITYKSPLPECGLSDPVDRWNWMWGQISYDINTFAVVAGLKPQCAGPVFNRLVGLHMIYPDGTINHCAKLYMQSIFKAQLNRISKPGRPKKEQ